MDHRTAVERLSWRRDSYGKSSTPVEAVYDGRTVAYIAACPLGWALRNYSIPAGQPSATEIHSTLDGARKAFELWISGLDIEP